MKKTKEDTMTMTEAYWQESMCPVMYGVRCTYHECVDYDREAGRCMHIAAESEPGYIHTTSDVEAP